MFHDLLQVLGLIGFIIIVVVGLLVWFDRGLAKEQREDKKRRESRESRPK